tara:strand:+ start:1897 stop:2115 length:219 start_codon:yes stop_codon:yes gene_type:complete
MSVENLIKSAIEKNAGEFESTFSNVMAAKMSAAIETKYEDMFDNSVVSDELEMPEEVEHESDLVEESDLESE